MKKNKLKFISLSLFMFFSFFVFQKQTLAEEITKKITATYKLELAEGKEYIQPRKAILEGKENFRGEYSSGKASFGYAEIVYNLKAREDFWIPKGKAVCEENPGLGGNYTFGGKLVALDRCWDENVEGWKNYLDYYDTYPSGSYIDESSASFFSNKKTIEYTITDTLDAYVLHGDTCKSAGGCIAVTNQIKTDDGSNLLAVYNKMDDSTINLWRSEFTGKSLECGDIIDQAKATKGKYTYGSYPLGDYDTYTDCKYSASIYALFNQVEQAGSLKIDGERQLLYSGIDKLEEVSKIRKSSEEGNYVCVAVHGKYTNKIEQSDAYIVLDTKQKKPEAAKEVCETIFRTDLFDAGVYMNSSGKPKLNVGTPNDLEDLGAFLWTFAVYKVVTADVKTEVLPVNKKANALTCGWEYTPKDGSPEVVSFSVGASISGGKLKFADIKNIGNLHAAIYLTPENMQAILNEDESALNLFQNNISYSDKDVNTNTVLAVLSTIAAVGLHIAAAIATGGASIALSIASAAVGVAAVVSAIVALPTELANYVGKKTGTYSVPDVYIRFPDNPNKGEAVSGVVCNFGDFVDDYKINSDYEASCEGILSGKFGKILSYILNIIRIVGCAILILFGLLDFVKPIVSGDAEMLQKSGTKFIKRLIVFVLLLFVPALVKLLLSLIDKTSCSL